MSDADGGNKEYEVDALEAQVEELKEKLEEALKLTPDGAAERISKLEDELLAKSKEVVDQADKNLKLQRELGGVKKEVQKLRTDSQKMRATLVASISGPKASVDNFKNISLDEMFRIHQKRATELGSGSSGRGGLGSTRRSNRGSSRPSSRASNGSHKSSSRKKAAADSPKADSGDDYSDDEDQASPGAASPSGEADSEPAAQPLQAVLAAEREIQSLKTHNRKLHAKVEQLEHDLDRASQTAKNVHLAKAKFSEMAHKAREEKAARLRTEREVQKGMEKVEALMEHIEKLMVHLKHEAAAKAKAFEAQRRAEKDIELLKNRNAVLSKKNSSRDRLINELKEGSKILEDQLRLMDEKYIELRNKLDWTRSHSQKEVRRIQKQATRLRAQVLMSRTASDVGAGPARRGSSRGATAPSPSEGGNQRSHGGRSGSGRMHESQSAAGLRDVRNITMPLDPAEDADPTLPWSNTRLSQTYHMS